MDETRFFIEWTAPDASLEIQAELVDIQRQLARWQLDWNDVWADPPRRAAAAEQAGLWSKELLEKSGLLAQSRA